MSSGHTEHNLNSCGPFIALGPTLKVIIACGNYPEEAKRRARAAGCSAPLIAKRERVRKVWEEEGKK